MWTFDYWILPRQVIGAFDAETHTVNLLFNYFTANRQPPQ